MEPVERSQKTMEEKGMACYVSMKTFVDMRDRK